MTASFFISLLNLALPIFVIQLLNRYISHGFEGTLYTLTSGVTIAILLQFGFRVVRTSLLSKMNEERDEKLIPGDAVRVEAWVRQPVVFAAGIRPCPVLITGDHEHRGHCDDDG